MEDTGLGTDRDQRFAPSTEIWILGFPNAFQSPCSWIMFYEAVAADNRRSISLAVSKDGIKDWRRLGRPVLEAGQPGSWDAGGVGSPTIVSMAGADTDPCGLWT